MSAKRRVRFSKRTEDHPIRIGRSVVVLTVDVSGIPRAEGRGLVVAQGYYPNWYLIRFFHDRRIRVRFINPDWTKNPKRSCDLLREFLRYGADSSVEEFFPDENS
jgi:hypothetical protein